MYSILGANYYLQIMPCIDAKYFLSLRTGRKQEVYVSVFNVKPLAKVFIGEAAFINIYAMPGSVIVIK